MRISNQKQPFTIKQATKHQRHYRNFAVGLGAFLLAYVSASILAPVGISSAADTSGSQIIDFTNNNTGYYVNVSGSSTLKISANAIPEGQLVGTTDTLITKTNSPRGFQLYISASPNYLYLNGDQDTSSQGKFSPIGGSLTSAMLLGSNTWGFAFNPASPGVVANNFQAAAIYTPDGGASETDDTVIPNSAATYTSVPETDTMIQSLDEANEPNGTKLDIYYGFKANTSLPSGNYQGTITYTALSDGITQNAEYMQDFTTTECAAMSTGSSVDMIDKRDMKWYSVTKLADGHCWMTSNLALDGGITLTPEDSNVTQNRTLNANIESGTTMTADRDYIYSGVAEQTTTNCGSYAYCVTSDVKYGNLYNWVAATAGVGTATSSNAVYESVCPKGWRLPDNTGDYSFNSLMSAYSLPTSNGRNGSAVQTIQQSPLSFSLSGIYNVHQGNRGFYWSRTTVSSSAADAYNLHFDSTNGDFYPQYTRGKETGYAVRCVFEGSFSQIATMQEMSASICKATAEGTTATLPDKRGRGNGGSSSEGYGIIKAKDGNCWMTTNFDLYNMTGANAIKAEDSDFTSGTYEIPASTTWNTNLYTEPKVHQATNSGYTDQVYYNWTAAVALTNGSTTQQQDQSICPKNWQLPINGDATTDKSYAKLLNDYGITTGPQVVANKTLGFTYSGLWNKDGSGGEGNQGSVGYFWSSTSTSASNARFLYYGLGGALTPQHDLHKGYGFSLRCVAR